MRKSVYFDLIRGLSAQMVLLGHCLNMFFPAVFLTIRPDGQTVAAGGHFYIQNLGVIVFFVLSGYLVTASALSHSARYGFRAFMLDRAVRIFLPFLPALVFVAIFDHLIQAMGVLTPYAGAIQTGPYPLAMNAIMLFNNPVVGGLAKVLHIPQLAATVYGTDAPLWTVVVEWWIYATFGLTALVLARGQKLGLSGWALLAFAALVPLQQLTSGSGLVLAWLVGMLFANASTKLCAMSRPLAWALFLACVGLATVSLLRNGMDLYAPVVVVAIAAGLMLGNVLLQRGSQAEDEEPAWLETVFAWPAETLSNYSYSLYLVHYSTLMYFVSLGGRDVLGIRGLLFAYVLCNVLAIAFWFAFERHYRKVRHLLHRRFEMAEGTVAN